ncbi:hypothetical protein [Methylobacterium sp. 37f]|uniref:hypothetical protein n=1 Tax=Methylobacterium sp. 37f TaxID=2817058 RepID=UPI001FFC4F18|nr:hypothetical protein [Methylobacterium sp. 37f]MCK2054766.1 hypothetical protein [Methylobacterium sp. 37f]
MTDLITREKKIKGNFQTHKTACKNSGTFFAITQDEWLAVWRSRPLREGTGYVVKRDDAGEWVPDNICFKPMKAKAPNTIKPKESRTLTVRQWAQEMRAKR